MEIRKYDGSLYKKSAFTAVRCGVQRKIKTMHPDWDIINDAEFVESGTAFRAQCVQLKKGLAKVAHKPAITDRE